ncbi:MAG: hypothetical protein ABIS06_00025 [Vicinamibacterales bacterium]
MRYRKFVVVAGSALALGVASTLPLAAQQESKSSPLAKQLTQVLDAAKLDVIGAADPETGSYVAALYIPGTQILVVSGKFVDDFLGPHRLSKKEYRELYMDLQGAAVAGSRLFAQDAGANGFILKPAGGGAADTYEKNSKTTVFDGAWKKAKIPELDYVKSFTEADEQYARVLTLLLAQAKPKTVS